MWLFTKYGFFSAVCARQGDGSHSQPVDTERIMVRARVRRHLETLRERFTDLLGDSEIKEFSGTDYSFRIFVPKVIWSKIVAELTNELDYDNFKSEVARHQGSDGVAYEHSLHDVWSVVYQLQEDRRD